MLSQKSCEWSKVWIQVLMQYEKRSNLWSIKIKERKTTEYFKGVLPRNFEAYFPDGTLTVKFNNWQPPNHKQDKS